MSSGLPSRVLAGRRSVGRRDAGRAENLARLRAAAVVGVFVAGALTAGSIVHGSRGPLSVVVSNSRLPVVNLASRDSVEWECPGPLPAGAGPVRSAVVVVNPGDVATTVEVDIEAVKAGSAADALPRARRWITVDAHGEDAVPLPGTGAASDDAVSVLAPTGSVGVFESVSGPATASTLHSADRSRRSPAPTPRAPMQAACSTGATSVAYLAAGSTAGRSQLTVSLFNPTATAAVGAISVATPSGVTSPPALQGVIVQPYSLQMFELARSVVQQPTLAVIATTSVGRLVLGASASVESDVTATTSSSGGGLLVGTAAPQQTWTMASGLELPGRTVSVRVFDPGPLPTRVTITCPVVGRPTIELSATVAAGRVEDVALPFAALAPSRSGLPAALGAGPITVRSAEGVGVVVSRETVEEVALHAETVALLAPSAQAADAWVLPATSNADAVAAGTTLAGGVVVANGGATAATVTVLQLSTGGSAGRTLRTLTLPAGGAVAVDLRLPPAGGTAFAGIEVESTAPVVTETDFSAVGTSQRPVPTLPMPVEGIPVER